MARDRDDDRRDDDQPADDAPRRRRRDDDDAPKLGPLDKMFRDTNVILLVLFGLLCGCLAAILGLVGIFTAKDPTAKKNAIIVTVVGFVAGLVWGVIRGVMAAGAAAVSN